MTTTLAGAALTAATADEPGTAAELGFVLGVLTLGVVAVLFVLRQAVTVYRTRAAAGREEELRELVTRSTTAQERSEARLAELSQRFTALERVLTDVE
jgi:uncharacterized protein HemX